MTTARSARKVSKANGLASRPTADMTPAATGSTTTGTRSLRATRQAWAGPLPPKATMAQPRKSNPRSLAWLRKARVMSSLTASCTPHAARSVATSSG